MKIRKEIKIGAIAVTAFVLAYFGLNFLKGVNLFSKENEYIVRLKNLNGVGAATPVLISGYKVGAVREVEFVYTQGKGYSATLHLSLSSKVNIPKGSTIRIKNNLLRGAEMIIDSDSIEVGKYLQSGDEIRMIENETDIMATVSDKVMPAVVEMLPELLATIKRINELATNPALDASLKNLQASTEQMQSMMQRLNASLLHLPQVMGNVNQLSQSLVKVGQNAESIKIDSIMHNLTITTENLRVLTEQVRSTQGTVGKLLNDTSLYNRLDSLANSADELIRDLKANPKRYVRLSLF